VSRPSPVPDAAPKGPEGDTTSRGTICVCSGTRPKDVPSRDSRAVLYDRYRGYDLRESEIQTLADLGKFRVINAKDLAGHGYGGDRGRMEREPRVLCGKVWWNRNCSKSPSARPLRCTR